MRRVLLVHAGSTWGGAAIALLRSFKALDDSGHFRPFLLFSAEGQATTISREMGLPVYVRRIATLGCGILGQRSLKPRSVISFFVNLLPCLRAIDDLCRVLEIDIVYLNTSVLGGAAIAARLSGLPIVWHVREVIDSDCRNGHRLIRFIRRCSDIVVTNSDFVKKHFGADRKVVRVYDGISLAKFQGSDGDIAALRQGWGCSPSASVVGIVGMISRNKGHLVFLRAIPHVLSNSPRTEFVVIGGKCVADGYEKTWRARVRRILGLYRDVGERMKTLAKKMGIDHSLHFAGWHFNMPNVYAALDVVVFPPIIPEGFGMPQPEAGAANVPVASSDIGPARELVDDGVTGLLAPPGDARALADAIICLLRDKPRAKSMGHAGREKAEKCFAEELYRRGIVKVFRQVKRPRDAAARGLGRAILLVRLLKGLFLSSPYEPNKRI